MNDQRVDRKFLRDDLRQEVDFSRTGQSRGEPMPLLEKPHAEGATLIDLPTARDEPWPQVDLVRAIKRRRSRRQFSDEPLTLHQLAFLLWATQGTAGGSSRPYFRTVPSAGARHAFETYLAAMNVTGLEPGVYRYLPLSHQLVLEGGREGLRSRVVGACLDQAFAGAAAVTFFWVAVPQRMEWRYGAAGAKTIALDAGHVCQNLYLACEAIAAGTCAIAAYDQKAADDLLGVDGDEEFTIYIAPVGRR